MLSIPVVDPKRLCGPCSLCCIFPAIPELDKPAYTPCRHLSPGGGCGIYEDRPDVCREFECNWRYGLAGGGSTTRPDRLGVLSTAHITPEHGPGLRIHIDPSAKPDAWLRSATIRDVAEKVAMAGGVVYIIRDGETTEVWGRLS